MTVSHDSLKRKLRLGCDTVESKDMQDELEAGNPSRAGGEAKPPARAAAGMPDEAVVHPIGLDGWAGGRATGALANQSGLSVLCSSLHAGRRHVSGSAMPQVDWIPRGYY